MENTPNGPRQARHDKSNKVTSLKVGDKVLVMTHPQSSSEHKKIYKFLLLYKGSGTINAVKGPNSYEVTEDSTCCSLEVQNV